MLSIRRFLDQGQRSDIASRVLPLVLESIWLHAVEFRPDTKRDFQRSIRGLSEALNGSETADEALVRAGEIIRELQAYNRDAENYLAIQGKELHRMVLMLTETVVQMCGSAAKSARNLQDIGSSLEQTTDLKDLHLLRTKLAEGLSSLKTEIEDQREQYTAIESTLRESAKQTSSFAKSIHLDPISGLEDRHSAIRCISEMCGAGAQLQAGIFQLENLDGANNRYGFETGDAILFMFSQHLAQNLPMDKLFRWRGPSFVAIIDRKISPERLRTELQRFATNRLEHTVRQGTRDIMIPVSWSWTVVRGDQRPDASAMIEKIDRFITEKAQTALP